MIEPMPRPGGSPMTAILLRRLMYPYVRPVARIVHEWYEHAVARAGPSLVNTDAACVVMFCKILPTVQGSLGDLADDLDQATLSELVACCLEAERERPVWDTLPAREQDRLLASAGIDRQEGELTPTANLTLWHLRTQLAVPRWYAHTQRSDA